MYNNYDYYDCAYFDPNRPHVPRMPLRNNGYGSDFFPRRPPFSRFSRPRMPISDWGRQLVNQQINKSQERWMRPFQAQTPMEMRPIAPRQPSKRKTEQSSAHTRPQSNGDGQSNSKEEFGQPEISENSKPMVPIPPKISAKEMWESSYREPVVIDVAKALDPKPAIKTEPETATASAKRRKNKGRREPYYKRKFTKKKPTAASEGASSEPGFGFDVSAATPAPDKKAYDASDVYPKMCKVCNVQLTGEIQAAQHYKGEVHKKNINQFLSGQAPESVSAKIDKVTCSLPLPTNTPECLRWEPDTNDRTTNTVRFCRLCSVRMTSMPNAKQHYSGKSHAKRIRIVERGSRPARKQFKVTQFVSGGTLGMQGDQLHSAQHVNYAPAQTYQTQSSVPVETTTFNLKSALPTEFNNNMTPSGQFYCQTCNVTIENAGSLSSHLQSKAHKQGKYLMKI